jgi:signal transduction histidine kinase
MERFTAGLMDIACLNTRKSTNNLNSIISDVLSFIFIQKRFTYINIQTALDPALPPMEADEDQISQLVLNLLNNASDAIKEAGRERGLIFVRTSVQEEHVCMSVLDNGTGIDPAIAKQLFSTRLTTKESGHGFGLVTCAKIIENHGGTVEIENNPSFGAIFIIRFPVNSTVQDV